VAQVAPQTQARHGGLGQDGALGPVSTTMVAG
jgi:hypothetical protein